MPAARAAGSAVYTLDVNHRSDPRLLQALATLYGRAPQPFLFPEIRFEPVRPRAGAREQLQPPGAALELLFVPRDERTLPKTGKMLLKSWGDEHLPRLVAYEIVHLLHSGAAIGGEPVKPRHVAVLCRTNAQAAATQAALSALGVPTVLEGDSSVFDSESAEELWRVLWAVAEPADMRKLVGALATAILGEDGAALHRMRADEAGLELWLERVARWNQVWHERGFVQMIQRVLDDAAVQQRLLTRTDGERKLTDLLHLSELLHQVSTVQHLGPLALLHWFAQMRSDPEARGNLAAEAEQIRLEHDEHAVKLTTVHRSKGLEYPIVFCPFLWAGLFREDKDVRFHDREDGDRVKLDLGSPRLDQHRQAARREEIAESLRLLYVALTRARHRCYVVWGRFRFAGSSPLGYLLHQGPLGAREPREVEERLKQLDDAALRAELQALCRAADGSIRLRDVRFDAPPPYQASELAHGELAARKAVRVLADGPRMTSFSRLTADAHATTPAGVADDMPDRDAAVPDPFALDQVRAQPEPAQERVVLHAFPGGSRPGSLIHAVYEHIDFARVDPAELGVQVQRLLALHGLDAALHGEALLHGIAASLVTPLDDRDPPLTLARIARAQRVNELEFTLCTQGSAATLAADRLASAFARHRAPACDPEYEQRLRALGAVALADFVKGFIDLVFRHEDRFFIVDYKSNWLGPHASDYQPSRLLPAMREHHYFLQYHLYALALHRHLQLRLPGYDYERHFGGVYYLFVRGMAPAHASGTGVFFDRPPRALIDALADAIGAHEVPA
jgi:exodeoxyribonuclease V beta subunit